MLVPCFNESGKLWEIDIMRLNVLTERYYCQTYNWRKMRVLYFVTIKKTRCGKKNPLSDESLFFFHYAIFPLGFANLSFLGLANSLNFRNLAYCLEFLLFLPTN